MRVAAALGILVLVAAGGAAALQFAPGADGPLVAKTTDAIRAASDRTLEKTADYWLGAAEKRQAKDIRGSGAALAIAIRLGRLEASHTGTKAVPDRMKRLFREHYPDEVLDEARWTVAEPGTRLGRVLARWPVKEGAVTLGNVIVFKTKSGARNLGLFAHELVHVTQYQKFGIDEFARRYAVDPKPIEEEARTKARAVVRSL